jgi:HSP20 family molecular chaperone IbpA
MTSSNLLSIEATQAGRCTTSNLDRRWPDSSLETAKLIGSHPLVFLTQLPPVEPVENGGEYKILVPTNGIDLRHFYVVATPDSLLIEVRIRNSFKHDEPDPVLAEIHNQRISRELRFRHPIEERGTIVQVRGGELQITCRKAATSDDKSWSEILHFDTRASLGSV